MSSKPTPIVPGAPAGPEIPGKALPTETILPVSSSDATKPFDLAAALDVSSNQLPSAETNVYLDGAIQTIKSKLSGADPAEYADEIIKKLPDTGRMVTDHNYADQQIDIYLARDSVRAVKERDAAVAELAELGAEIRSVSPDSVEVTRMVREKMQVEVTNHYEIANARAVGEAALGELEKYHQYQRILGQHGKDEPKPTPRISQEQMDWESLISRFDGDWQDPQKRANILERAKIADTPEQAYVAGRKLDKAWAQIPPEKQDDMIRDAADRCADRVGALGEEMIRRGQPVGVALLFASDRIDSPQRLEAITNLPGGQAYRTRLKELVTQGGKVLLTDDRLISINSVEIKPRIKDDTQGIYVGKPIGQSLREEGRFGNRTEKVFIDPKVGGKDMVARQMLGMEAMTTIQQRL